MGGFRPASSTQGCFPFPEKVAIRRGRRRGKPCIRSILCPAPSNTIIIYFFHLGVSKGSDTTVNIDNKVNISKNMPVFSFLLRLTHPTPEIEPGGPMRCVISIEGSISQQP